MSLNEILQSCHGVAKSWHHITAEEVETFYRNNKENTRSLEESEKIIEKMPIIVVDNFSQLFNIYYFDCEKLVCCECLDGLFQIFNPNIVSKQFSFENKIKEIQKAQDEAIQKHNYDKALLMIPDAFRFYCLEHNTSFPEQQKFRLWLEIYNHVDYGADGEQLRAIIPHPLSPQPDLSKFEGDNLTIFRGEGSLSQPWKQAISWTTEPKTAVFFACKGYQSHPRAIYQGICRKQDVIAYITSRNENEIIIFPENVQHVKKLDIFSQETPEFQEEINNVADKYHFYTSAILPEWYPENSAHNIGHIHRTILFGLIVFDKDKNFHYTKTDEDIIMYFSALHDIGRTNDTRDKTHGQKSLNQIRQQNIVYYPAAIADRDLNWAKLFIKFHCCPDTDGYAAIKEMAHSQGEFVKMKYLFNICKDIDALDRFRINDLNPKFLRSEISKQLIFWASAISHGVK